MATCRVTEIVPASPIGNVAPLAAVPSAEQIIVPAIVLAQLNATAPEVCEALTKVALG